MIDPRWTIQVRVTYKSDVMEWHAQRGQDRLFTVLRPSILDESGEILATGFNDQVDSFYDQLKEGRYHQPPILFCYGSNGAGVLRFSKCRVKIAKKQFSNVQNEYELMFERDTQIEEVHSLYNKYLW
jgi:replication factor A1